MKKFLTVLFVVAVVTALFCGVTAFAAAEPATVVADEGWTNATYDAETQILTNVDEGYSFLWAGGNSIAYNGTTPLTAEKVVIPSSVNGVAITAVGSKTFGSGNTVKHVIFSEGIKSFSKPGFSGYSTIETVRLPSTMTTLGQEVFRYCSALTTINIPDGVTKIDNYTFATCSSLKSITLPQSLTSLGTGVFAQADLESIVIPSGVSYISKECFKQNANLATVVCKGNITGIGADAFRLASSLTEIRFEGNTEAAPTLTMAGTRYPYNSGASAVAIYYPASAHAAFTADEFKAGWPSESTFNPIGELPVVGGCSISARVEEGTDTTVTYSAVDTNNNPTVVVLIALYNGDAMIGAKTVSMADTTATFAGVTGATKAKIFMWTDLRSATPLYESAEY